MKTSLFRVCGLPGDSILLSKLGQHPDAALGLHWVDGTTILPLDASTREDAQTRDRFYDAGLLSKHLRLSPEPLRQLSSP